MLNEIKDKILSEKKMKIKTILRNQYELVERKRKELDRLTEELNKAIQQLEKMDKATDGLNEVGLVEDEKAISANIVRADEFLNEFDPPATSILYVGKYINTAIF